MQTATRWSLLPRISAILLVLTLSPLAALAQLGGVLPAVREFSLRDLAPMSPSVGKAFMGAVTAHNAADGAVVPRYRFAVGDVKQSDIRELMRFRLSYDEARDRLLLAKAAERFPHSHRSAEVRARAAALQSDRRNAEMEYLIRWAKRKLRRPKQGAASLSRSSGKTTARRVKGPSTRRR